MTITDQRTLDAALRVDFGAFLHRCFLTLNPGAAYLHNWHIDAISFQLGRIYNGEANRLIVNLPPRHLKSITASVAFTAYVLGHNPKLRIIGISYGEELAKKHAADFRVIVESQWFRRAFPRLRITRSADGDFYTSERGFRKCTSVYATLTGLGGNLFILDDVQKPVDALSEVERNKVQNWFSNTLLSRLDNKKRDAIIIVMQRVHLQDLTGYLLERGGWQQLSVSAIAEQDERIQIGPNRFHYRKAGEALHPRYEPLETLEQLRGDLGSEVFAAQYQQAPVPPGGGLIKKDWLSYYTEPPERRPQHRLFISWDTAAKVGSNNDWSVCTVWLIADKNYYLLDMVRGRYEYPRLRELSMALADRHKPFAILIENSSTGIALGQELKGLGRYPIRLVPPEHDKIGRLFVQQAKFEAKLVHFPKEAPYLADIEKELLTFPQGRTDDIVDSISQALAFKAWGYDYTLSNVC